MKTQSAVKLMVASAVLSTLLVGRASAAITIGTEDPVSGFTGLIPGTFVQVGSDGESPFTPFNIPVDVSDAIFLDNQVAAGNPWAIDPLVTGWTQLPGTSTWYIDAASVGENEPPVAEPIGIWHSPNPWNANVLGEYRIQGGSNEPGEFDRITLYNDAFGAAISFESDASDVPEPASLGLLGLGILGMVCRRRKTSN
jgi:hypothetical protein